MKRTWFPAAALLLLVPGLSFAQLGPVNPARVGNPSYTGYGQAPLYYQPGAFGNPSYTGTYRSGYVTGFNPSYTGYDVRPYAGAGVYSESTPYLSANAPFSVYRYNGQGTDGYSALTTQSSYYSPQGVVAPAAASFETPPEDRFPKAVTLDVRVPTPAAEVFVEGGRTTSRGTERTFVSPKLEPGQRFTYEIRARWVGQDGKEVEQTRRVPVTPGQTVTVDFNKPEK
jgi:uncharacterized protein (TIGR03000 family)